MQQVSSRALADQAFALLQAGVSVVDVRQVVGGDAATWSRVSALMYDRAKRAARKERDLDAKRRYVATTSNADINKLLALNKLLATYAMLAPPKITLVEFRQIEQFAASLPGSEAAVLAYIGSLVMTPKMCAILKQGVAGFSAFNSFTPLVEAAILSYHQENYVSAFLTLVPVVEGIILRWGGFDGTGLDSKPQFEDIRRFVGNSYLRQPNPANVLFHEVYVQASQAILTGHLYRNSAAGPAYANFSRHLAAHLLRNDPFATQDNCIRLFILLDALLTVYTYETKPTQDPRFHVDEQVLRQDVGRYHQVRVQRRIFQGLFGLQQPPS